jgi:hypothetical protein
LLKPKEVDAAIFNGIAQARRLLKEYDSAIYYSNLAL